MNGDINLRDEDTDHQQIHRTRVEATKKWNAKMQQVSSRADKELQKDLTENWKDFDMDHVISTRYEATTWTRAIGHYRSRMERLANSQHEVGAQGNLEGN